MRDFTFDGIRKDFVYPARGSDRPMFASRAINLIEVKGRAGAYLQGTDTKVREIVMPIFFESKKGQNMQLLKEEIAEWLVKDTPRALTMDDEPGRVYYALVDNLEFDDWFKWGEGVITFICPDPYKYGEEITQNITTNPYVENEGTAETYPTFEIDVLEDLTRIEVANKSLEDRQGGNPAIILGEAASLEQEEFVREQLAFQDNMRSTASWQTASEVDSGYIDGEMDVDIDGFYPKLVGGMIEPPAWQGPSLIKGLGKGIQDFRAEFYIKSMNVGKETGMIDVYLRDANQRIVSKISFGDAWVNKDENFAVGQVGDYDTGKKMVVHADNQYGWNNFDGMVRMERIGKVWRFYYAKIGKDGVHNWVHSTSRYTDNSGHHLTPIHYVQVHMRIFPASERTKIHLKQIKIYEIHDRKGRSETIESVDPMERLGGWTNEKDIDHGYADTGTLGVTADGITALTYGPAVNPYSWQGPSMIKKIPPVQDFRLEVTIEQLNSTLGLEGTGLIEVYLRDADRNIMAKIGMVDVKGVSPENQGIIQIGARGSGLGHSARAAVRTGWNDYDGVIHIQRVNNEWKAYFAKVDAEGVHNWKYSTIQRTDHSRKHLAPIAYIQFALRTWAGTTSTESTIKEIRMIKINQIEEEFKGVPYIATNGDKIVIDTKKSTVTKNGEDIRSVVDIPSQMFHFAKGTNKLRISPESAVSIKAKYRNAYL